MKAAVLALAIAVVLTTSAIATAHPRTISEKEVTDVIRHNLQYHAPQYVVLLDQAYPDAGVRDLLRAGLLETISETTNCSGPQWTLGMTQEGRSIAWARGWPVYRNVLTIQVGSLQYVPQSAEVLRSQGQPYAVRFKFRYTPDSNANTLLGIGPAHDWTTGDGFTLADSGHTYTKTVPLYFSSARGWYLKEEWATTRTVVC